MTNKYYQNTKKNSKKKHTQDIKIFLKKKKFLKGKKRFKKKKKVKKKCHYYCEPNKNLSQEQK